MSKQDQSTSCSSRAQQQQQQQQLQGWKSAEFNMTTSPSVGRFSKDQQATLYVRGSSAKFDDNDGRKTMAPYSNHGHLPGQPQQQPSSDIVDLKTPAGSEYKPMKPKKSARSNQK